MNVVVTGGAGFIGSVLCENLIKYGYKVTCVDNFSNSSPMTINHLLRDKNFSFIKQDVSSKFKVDKFDVVVHLAGLVGFPRCANNITLSKIWNIDSTKRVLDLAAIYDAKVVYASTGSVYGKIDGVCTEESNINPVSQYGIDKYEAELEVYKYNGSISYRFATGFGVSNSPRFDLLPNSFLHSAMKDGFLGVFQGDARRTFISVKEMARSLIFAIEKYSNSRYPVYNVGTEELNMTKSELINNYIAKLVSFKQFVVPGSDPDQRDYEVSYQRLKDFGFFVKNDMMEQLTLLNKIWKVYL